jgi:hypothetical protein
MEREIVITWHYNTCPIATGEEIGDAYCACTYIERTIKELAQDGLITNEQMEHLINDEAEQFTPSVTNGD